MCHSSLLLLAEHNFLDQQLYYHAITVPICVHCGKEYNFWNSPVIIRFIQTQMDPRSNNSQKQSLFSQSIPSSCRLFFGLTSVCIKYQFKKENFFFMYIGLFSVRDSTFCYWLFGFYLSLNWCTCLDCHEDGFDKTFTPLFFTQSGSFDILRWAKSSEYNRLISGVFSLSFRIPWLTSKNIHPWIVTSPEFPECLAQLCKLVTLWFAWLHPNKKMEASQYLK